MNKVYNQKENVNIYIGLLLLMITVYTWGVWLINYHSFILIGAVSLMIFKIIKISKNPEVPVVKLTDTEIELLITNKTYNYSEISMIHINSKWLNGHLILKESNKKQIINSVAISLEDQKEIREFVLSKIRE